MLYINVYILAIVQTTFSFALYLVLYGMDVVGLVCMHGCTLGANRHMLMHRYVRMEFPVTDI